MSIPKVIHYCWFGRNPLPHQTIRCIRSWKKHCPEYKIRKWTEDNFDVTSNAYMREAYEAGKWAFVSDYARLKILYDYGGIYLDTDVKLLRSLDPLLEQEGFMGFQHDGLAATGLGFGVRRHHPLIKALLDDYQELSFLLGDGSFCTAPCSEINFPTLQRFGLHKNDGTIQKICGISFYPPDYFDPMDFQTGIVKKTSNTFSIHCYSASWHSPEWRKWHNRQLWKGKVQQYGGPVLYKVLDKGWKLWKRKDTTK